MVDILAVCVFARREELRRVFTEIVFQRSVDTHLVDYNYNVEVSSVLCENMPALRGQREFQQSQRTSADP